MFCSLLFHANTHTYIRTYTRTYVHTHTRTHTPARTHTYTRTRTHIRTNTHTHTHTHIHTYTHTHTHTHTHIYTHTDNYASYNFLQHHELIVLRSDIYQRTFVISAWPFASYVKIPYTCEGWTLSPKLSILIIRWRVDIQESIISYDMQQLSCHLSTHEVYYLLNFIWLLYSDWFTSYLIRALIP